VERRNLKQLNKHNKSYRKKAILVVKKLLNRKIFGFTIIELIVAITIIAILAAISLVAYSSIQRKATIASIQNSLRDASNQLDIFQVINSNLPKTMDCDQPESSANICLKSGNNEIIKYSTNKNNNEYYYVTIEKNGYTYNINEDGTIFAGTAPVLGSSADNYVSYNGAGNSWKDINTNAVQNGGYFNFNGSNNFISSKYLTNPNSENITVAVWVKQGGKNGTYEIMGQGRWGTDFWTNWSFSQIGQTMKFNLTDKYSMEYQCSGGQFNTNSWHYVVGIWDGNFMRTYLDGAESASCDKTTAKDSANGSHPIGKYVNEPYYFNGLTGDIKVYDEYLSASDIRENFIISSKFYGI